MPLTTETCPGISADVEVTVTTPTITLGAGDDGDAGMYSSSNVECLFNPNNFDGVSADDVVVSGGNGGTKPSLIHKIFNNNNFQYDSGSIEDTKNAIWLKPNTYSWAHKKPLSQLRLIELFSYVVQNSIRNKDNIIDARFLLWCDIKNKWHFKSVGKLIEENSGSTEQFYVNPQSEHLSNKIYHIRTISTSDNIANMENDIFYSSYRRIDPNYEDPYIDFTDTQNSKKHQILKYNYDKEFGKIPHIGSNKLIDSNKGGFNVTVSGSTAADTPITVGSFDTQLTQYGYYDNSRYNSPTNVWWETVGTYGLDTDSNNKWQTQYDITDVKFNTIFDIYHKIKVPLIKNRKKFNTAMNLKRKWEAYRCVNCCLDQPIGSSEDVVIFENALNNPAGSDFQKIYGEGGVFSYTGILRRNQTEKTEDKYGVVAAGSFTDLINYWPGEWPADANGLFMSRNMGDWPYTASISEFYNLSDNIVNNVIQKSETEYETTIVNNKKRMNVISNFLSKVDNWITSGIEFINLNVVHCEECNESINRESIIKIINNWFSLSDHSVSLFDNNAISQYFEDAYSYGGYVAATSGASGCHFTEPFDDGAYSKGIPCGFKERYAGPNIPITSFTGGSIFGYSGPLLSIEGISAKIPYIELPPDCCLRTINFGNTDGGGNKFDGSTGPVDSYLPKFQYLPDWCKDCSKNIFVRGKDNPFELSFNKQSKWGIVERHGAAVVSGGYVSYNENCFNPNILIALKQQAKNEYNALLTEYHLLTALTALHIQNTSPHTSLKQQNSEWRNRSAFFYSKTPGSGIFYKGVTGGGIQQLNSYNNEGEGNSKFRKKQLKQKTSLQGIKSITRRNIRDSRYEILAKSKGISESSTGYWLYNIAFGEDNPGAGNDTRTIGINDQQTCPISGYVPGQHPYYDQKYKTQYNNDVQIETDSAETTMKYTGNREIDIPISIVKSGQNTEPQSFNGTPPNIIRESIASYVRVEFSEPIGLDRIADFPSGFVRDAGCEYFLPYLVSLTAGPTGRQTIRNNIAVIGMDPYGFDVAVKKMKIEQRYDAKNYWWWEGGNPDVSQTGLSQNGMDLWPEFMFETQYPYYQANPYGTENLLTDDEVLNKTEHKWKRSAEFDPERRKTAMGSGYLMSSHRKIKPHRSWWSCYIPQNLFIPQKLHSMINEISSNFEGEICQFYRHGYIHTKTIENDDFDGWLTFIGSTNTSGPQSIEPFLKNTSFEVIT